MLRLIKESAKSMLRRLVRWRLHSFPLTEAAALVWSERIKRWPAIFRDADFVRRTELPGGIQMDLGLVDHIERELWVNGVWDAPVKAVLDEWLRPGDAFLDLGANIGYFTLQAARRLGPTGRVVAIEPSIRALRKLTNHLWLNQCSNVVLFSVAASDHQDIGVMQLATESNIGGSAVATGESETGRSESIMLLPLDDLLLPIDMKLRLVKIDLEGSELAALRGIRRLLEKHRPAVACEVTEKYLRKFGDSADGLVAFFTSLDYSWRPLTTTGNDVTAADLSDPNRQFDVIFLPREQAESK